MHLVEFFRWKPRQGLMAARASLAGGGIRRNRRRRTQPADRLLDRHDRQRLDERSRRRALRVAAGSACAEAILHDQIARARQQADLHQLAAVQSRGDQLATIGGGDATCVRRCVVLHESTPPTQRNVGAQQSAIEVGRFGARDDAGGVLRQLSSKLTAPRCVNGQAIARPRMNAQASDGRDNGCAFNLSLQRRRATQIKAAGEYLTRDQRTRWGGCWTTCENGLLERYRSSAMRPPRRFACWAHPLAALADRCC